MRPALIVRRAAEYLTRHDVESPLATAEILLAKVLGTDRARLYTRDEGLSTAEAKRFGRALCQRCVGVPLQHLTGEQGFRRLTLVVKPGVFIPRPETEILVERALAAVADVPAPVVVDVGTGTGAIALAIKDERPDAQVLAIDVSPDAVALARENAVRSNLDIEVMPGDLLDGVPVALHGAVDLVVSNPPYVEEHELSDLPREVRADPVLALAGGVGMYQRLFGQASEVLRPGGAVAVEIGETQGPGIRAAISCAGFVTIEVDPDLTGRDRVMSARMPA
jgi:release factor glutamine methyltransferase